APCTSESLRRGRYEARRRRQVAAALHRGVRHVARQAALSGDRRARASGGARRGDRGARHRRLRCRLAPPHVPHPAHLRGLARRERDRRHAGADRPRGADPRRDGRRGDAHARACASRVLPLQRRIAFDGNNGCVDSLRGHLLVASPALLDPNFRRTVVLITEHTDDGAAGLVLNRPSLVEVAAAVPQLEELVDEDEQVWVGGPVQPEGVLVLGEFLDPDDAAVSLFDALGFPPLDEPEEIVPATTRRRVFAGYAGWGAGQLEEEVANEDWILEAALADDAFTEEPDELWREVLRRKGGIYEL